MLTLKLRCKQPDGESSRLMTIAVIDEATPLDEASDNFRFSAAVAEFGMLLRGSEFSGTATFATAADLARSARGADGFGYRAEFIDLCNRCKDMGFELAQED